MFSMGGIAIKFRMSTVLKELETKMVEAYS